MKLVNTISTQQLIEWLPFLIPLIIIQFGLALYAWVKLLKQKNTRYLNKFIWSLIILFIQFIGPIIYLTTEGKES